MYRFTGVAKQSFHIRGELQQEEDGRWIADFPDYPGVMAYGATAEEAQRKVMVILLGVLAEQLQSSEQMPPQQVASLMNGFQVDMARA
jgi:predicted RNase H-like HicB family nuclease